MSEQRTSTNVLASIVPVREIPPKPKRHKWVTIGQHEWACRNCAQVKKQPGLMRFAYFNREGKYVGHLAPLCDGVPA